MPTDEIERLHYYQKQYLGAADFEAQQQYHRDMRRRHNLGQHTWGIVTGLDLIEKTNESDPTAVDVYLSPGMAVDGFGRELVVFEPVKIDSALFDSFVNLAHHSIWLAYDQHSTDFPKAGYQVCAADDYARIEETFRLVVDAEPPPHDLVNLAGNPVQPPDIPADESVPEQEFPDDADQPLWLVCLGNVRWDGVNRKFVPAAPKKAPEGRHYAGAVCEQVIGPAGRLVLRDRTAPDPLPGDPKEPGYGGVSAEVAGALQIDRFLTAKQDVEVHGGRISFMNAKGEDDEVPLWLSRQAGPKTPGTADLRIHIGDRKIGEDDAAYSRLTVGNFEANGKDESVIFDVKGDNTVDIPTGTLGFGDTKRQMISLKTAFDGSHPHGIGVQANTTYFRTEEQFCWFQKGVHSDDASKAGSGGTLQLLLDNGGLHFGQIFQQMLNLWDAEYGIGVQNGALYFRSASEFCWYRHGVHNTAKENAGGGDKLMVLDDSSVLTLFGSLTAKNGITVGEDLKVDGNLNVDGDLSVKGKQNLINVKTETFDWPNGGPVDTPGVWIMHHPGEFSKVYARYAVMHGFSLMGPVKAAPNHSPLDGRYPQQAYVLVDAASDDNSTSGTCYTQQAQNDINGNEGNNHTLFTVVVIGKGV